MSHVPPVPGSRLHLGAEWRELWERAHREMTPYGREPHYHLIDRIMDYPKRGYLANRFDWIASITQQGGWTRDRTYLDRRVWHWPTVNPDTMKEEVVRIVLLEDLRTILTAFPE